MFVRDWTVMTKVLKMRLRLFPPLFISLMILMILNALNIDVVPLILKSDWLETTMPIVDPKTKIKSKIFQLSLK